MCVSGGWWLAARPLLCVSYAMVNAASCGNCVCVQVGWWHICGGVALGKTQVSVRRGSWSVRWVLSVGCARDSPTCHCPIVFHQLLHRPPDISTDFFLFDISYTSGWLCVTSCSRV